MRLYVQKDKPNDQAYIGFRPEHAGKRGSVKKTVRVTDDIAVDLDGRGRLLGLDVANAKRVLGKEALAETFLGDELVGVAEAAKLCSVRKPNFIRDFASRPDFPKPVVELASGRIWRRSDIDEFLERIRGIIEFAYRSKVTPDDYVRTDNLVRRQVHRATKRAAKNQRQPLARPAASRPAVRPKTAPRRTRVSR